MAGSIHALFAASSITLRSIFCICSIACIARWARPVCYQNFSADILPPELVDANPRRIMRTVDGKLTRD